MKPFLSSPKPRPTARVDVSRAMPSRAGPHDDMAAGGVKLKVATGGPLAPGKRRTRRKPLWCVCSLYSGNTLLLEAVIMDVSQTGARIRFQVRCQLPGEVRIKASRIGLNRAARVVWQDSQDAGLEFIPAEAGA